VKKLTLLFIVSLLLMPMLVSAEKKPLKVEIVTASEDTSVKTQGGGLIGAIQGAKTHEVVFMVNALINGDHARLKCYENHRGCTALGPGMYDAEMDEKNGDVWITIVLPVSHKIVRDHWRVAGTWETLPPKWLRSSVSP
jgi:hypothetical protein